MISELSLWAFTCLTGMVAGAYIIAAIFPAREEKKPWLFPLVSLVVLIVGGVSAIGHLHRPELVMNVLNNPAASLTMEGIFTGVMAAAIVVDLVFSLVKKSVVRATRILCLVAGIVLIAIEAYAYLEVYGITAWTGVSTFALFVLSDIASGGALWLLFRGKCENDKTYAITMCALAAAAAIAEFWKLADFVAFGADGVALLALGGVAAICGAVVAGIMYAKDKLRENKGLRIALVVLIIASMALSRYGFYMASIL